jgi:hypothetical protein
VKEAIAETGGGYLKTLGEQLGKYQAVSEETGSAEQAKLALLADQMGVDLRKTSEEERRSLLKLLGRSKFLRFFKKRK